MILVRLYIFIVAIIGALICYGVGIQSIPLLARFVMWALGIDVRVYGKIDPDARVVVFNHPRHDDPIVIASIVGPIAALVANINPVYNAFYKRFGCVVVSKDGGTLEKLVQKMQTNKLRYGVALTNHLQCTGGKRHGDRIEHARTIAFRLNEPIQPIVLMVDSCNCPKESELQYSLLFQPLYAQTRVRAYILPKMSRRHGETPEAFAERTKAVMNRWLARAWEAGDAHAAPIADRTNAYLGFCLSIVGIICAAKGLYAYGATWILLSIASALYHTHQTTERRLFYSTAIAIVLIMTYRHIRRRRVVATGTG